MCVPGHEVVGEDKVVCDNSGELWEINGECKPVSCGRPQIHKKSVLVGSDFKYGKYV